MRTRSLIAVIGLCALVATAVIIGQGALATADPLPQLELNALTPTFTLGGMAELEVLVGPEAQGGEAILYAKVMGRTEEVMRFGIIGPMFGIQAPVPSDPAYIGRRVTYQYQAFALDGHPLGASKKADGFVVDPEIE